MDELVIIHEIDRLDNLHCIVRQDLKELGVKLPKWKRVNKLNKNRSRYGSQTQDDVFTNAIFGEPLKKLAGTLLTGYGYVPQFLIDAAKVVDANIDTEGIFRKSGSITRQKELMRDVEAGKPLDSANIHDVASLIKQFFRKLPEPIFITIYHESFVRCFSLSPEKDQKRALLELCLLLPLENIGALRYTLHLLNRIAAKNMQNKMTSNNLAVVMAPNLVHLNKAKEKVNSGEEKLLHIHTSIIQLLITNWHLVGMVSGAQRQQLSMMAEWCGTDDEQLEANDENAVENTDAASRKKRKRSGSLTGFVSSLAHGFAKLRRSTDGKNMYGISGANMTSNMDMTGNTTNSIDTTSMSMTASINMTTSSGEDMSLLTHDSISQTQGRLVDTTTPCVIRKRPMCADSVAFSAAKKQAILGNLPQRSALASTPFTPASTLKSGYYNPRSAVKAADLNITAPAFGSLNVTTPALGSKNTRKKLNLFTSPSSSKMKRFLSSFLPRPTVDPTAPETPSAEEKPDKSKNFFRRLSGSRARKNASRNASASMEPSEDQLAGFGIDSTASSITSAVMVSQPSPLSALDESVVVVDDQDSINDSTNAASVLINTLKKQNCAPDIMCEAEARDCEVASNGQDKSECVDDHSLRKECPLVAENDQLDRKPYTPRRQILAKLDFGRQSSAFCKVADDQNSGLRRSRRDEFEKRKKNGVKPKHEGKQNDQGLGADFCLRKLELSSYWHVEDSPDPGRDSPSLQSRRHLLDVLLPPPRGFGDQSLLKETDIDGTAATPDEDIDVGSDLETISVFSSSSGVAVTRTDSGQYLIHHSKSSTSLDSSESYDSALKPSTTPKALQTSVSNDSLFSTESYMSDGSIRSAPRHALYSSSDSGKSSLLGDAAELVSLPGCDKSNGAAVMKDKFDVDKKCDSKKRVSFR
ncbi:hypothetical protein BsWGS_10054 [Bradybaena similaris]